MAKKPKHNKYKTPIHGNMLGDFDLEAMDKLQILRDQFKALEAEAKDNNKMSAGNTSGVVLVGPPKMPNITMSTQYVLEVVCRPEPVKSISDFEKENDLLADRMLSNMDAGSKKLAEKHNIMFEKNKNVRIRLGHRDGRLVKKIYIHDSLVYVSESDRINHCYIDPKFTLGYEFNQRLNVNLDAKIEYKKEKILISEDGRRVLLDGVVGLSKMKYYPNILVYYKTSDLLENPNARSRLSMVSDDFNELLLNNYYRIKPMTNGALVAQKESSSMSELYTRDGKTLLMEAINFSEGKGNGLREDTRFQENVFSYQLPNQGRFYAGLMSNDGMRVLFKGVHCLSISKRDERLLWATKFKDNLEPWDSFTILRSGDKNKILLDEIYKARFEDENDLAFCPNGNDETRFIAKLSDDANLIEYFIPHNDYLYSKYYKMPELKMGQAVRNLLNFRKKFR